MHTSFTRKDLLYIALILLVAFLVRLYKFDIPLADFHSWRQADTAAVARNFIKHGFDLIHPRFDDLSNIQSGLENPQGYRMVEFPLYNALFGYSYKILPILTLEEYGRLTSIVFSLILIAIIYYFTLREAGRSSALVAAGVYAVFPFFVFFSRVILPETMALSLMFLSLLFLYFYAESKKKVKTVLYYILSLFFCAAALLVKPTVIFFLGASLILFIRRHKGHILKFFPFYLYFALAIVPLALWRYYISFYPEGVPLNLWLIDTVNTYQGKKIIFLRPSFFRWIFFERINNIILGGFLTVFFVLGSFVNLRKYFLHAILFCSLLYLFIFEGGNVQHEYYQILILPALAIFVGIGTSFLLSSEKRTFITPLLLYPTIVALFLLSLFFSFFRVRDYYNYSTDLKKVADIIQSVTREDDKIVTDRQGDTTLLYLANRRGAPATYKNLPELKKSGYSYFVTFNKDVIEAIKKEETYPLYFEEKEKFAIFKL